MAPTIVPVEAAWKYRNSIWLVEDHPLVKGDQDKGLILWIMQMKCQSNEINQQLTCAITSKEKQQYLFLDFIILS